MADRGELGNRISSGRRVERDAQHNGRTLQHIDSGAVRDIAEASRCTRGRKRPGQRAIAARSGEHAVDIGRIDIVARSTCITA